MAAGDGCNRSARLSACHSSTSAFGRDGSDDPSGQTHQTASMRGSHDAVPVPTMMKPSGWRWNPPEEGRDVRLLGLCLCVVSASVIATMALNVVGRVFIDVNSQSTGWNLVDAIIKDDYYVYALPTLIPGCITYVYFNWLASQFFAHT